MRYISVRISNPEWSKPIYAILLTFTPVAVKMEA